ncbi:MAG: hypothetical protein P0S96_02655 [Simkaniaceae bacterium]|nr:hypothetical protein [Candidatus Sacchlamyda saccharinae]
MAGYLGVCIDHTTTCPVCQDAIGPENKDVVTHMNPSNIQEGAGCHFHKDCAREWALQKDECPICKAGIRPQSILSPADIREREAMRKAEVVIEEADQSSEDERLARELAADQGGAGAGTPDFGDDIDPATAAAIAAAVADDEVDGFGARAAMSDADAVAAAIAASLGDGGGSGAGAGAAASPPVRRRAAPAAAAPASAPVAVGGVAPVMRDRCNQALALLAGVAGAVAAVSFTILLSREN